MAFSIRTALLAPVVLAFSVFPALALAQSTPAPAPAPASSPASPIAPAPPATSTAPAGPITGYGWGGDTPPAPAPRRHAYYRPAGPTALLPGFEALSDGTSRFFVELTKAVPVVEQKGKGTITYVLRGAHVAVHNNYRPLVTVHFNTPVWRARLVASGGDVRFVLEMRADVTPTWTIDTPQAGGPSTLEVNLPAGSFLADDMPEMAASGQAVYGGGPPVPGAPATAPRPMGGGGHHGGHGGGHQGGHRGQTGSGARNQGGANVTPP